MATDTYGPMDCTIIPIQIRPDVTVRIQGIPHDLTQAEANKLAAVVIALAAKGATDGN